MHVKRGAHQVEPRAFSLLFMQHNVCIYLRDIVCSYHDMQQAMGGVYGRTDAMPA